MEKRQHPINIVENMGKLIFLLLIPVLRGLLSYSGGGITAWITGAWLDIVIVGTILSVAVIRWLSGTYRITGSGIAFQKGVLIRREISVDFDRISTLTAESLFYYKLFRAVRVRADTDGGGRRSSDIRMTLREADAEQLLALNEKSRQSEESFIKRVYKPKGLYIAAVSAVLSNSFAGVLLASTFISNLGSILGEEFKNRIYGTVAYIARLLAFGLSPAAAALGYAIMGGWLVAFISNLIRHKNFTAVRSQNILQISGGLFTTRRYSVTVENINYLDICQSVSTKILRLYTVFMQAAGYGKSKNDMSLLVPAAGYKELTKTLKLLVPEYSLKPRSVYPRFRSIMRFLTFPLVLMVLLWASARIFLLLLPSWKDLILFSAVMIFLLLAWFLALRLTNFFTTGISFDKSFVILRYSKGYYLHTALIPHHKISRIEIRQTILQRWGNTCDVVLYSYSEGKNVHRVKSVDRKQALTLMGLLEKADTVK